MAEKLRLNRRAETAESQTWRKFYKYQSYPLWIYDTFNVRIPRYL